MSKLIKIGVKDRIATVSDPDAYALCLNSDTVVEFVFDAEWSRYPVKTARFRYGGRYTDVVFFADKVTMPAIDADSVEIGVFTDKIMTTTAAYVPMRRTILSRSGLPALPPDSGLYAQLTAAINLIAASIGNMNDLQTAANATLVAAINEAAQSGGAGINAYVDGDILYLVGEGVYVEDDVLYITTGVNSE